MPSSRVVTVTAPSRLHFGLFSFGHGGGRQFGGAGMMIAEPATAVCVSAADEFSVDGPNADRAIAAVKDLITGGMLDASPDCRVEILASPPAHVGLGSGTQLALSVATAVLRWARRPVPKIKALAQALGRGARSAIGTHGFVRGGFLVDWGKQPEDDVAPLAARVALPDDWRVLLLLPTTGAGIHGDE